MAFTKIDSEYTKEVLGRVRSTFTNASAKIAQHTAATLQDFQNPNVPTRSFIPGGIGYEQSEFIGSSLLPETSSSPDGTEQATYPTFGKEAFFVSDDLIAPGSKAKQTQGTLAWSSITLDVRGKMEYIVDRVARIAATLGQNERDNALARIKQQVMTGKEYRQALLLTSTGSYSSSSYYETLSGTGQWSHASSDPLKAWLTKAEVLRVVNGKRPNTFWSGAKPMNVLSYNPALIALVNGGATRANPAFPISAALIASLLGMNVFVGEAVYTSTVGGSFADVWGDNAGLLYVGPAQLVAPKFGATLTSSGYPIINEGRDEQSKSDWVDYWDAYKAVVQSNTAGYLWQDTAA
jgi:hypothetical protein